MLVWFGRGGGGEVSGGGGGASSGAAARKRRHKHVPRWKAEPLKCRGLPALPIPFSPVVCVWWDSSRKRVRERISTAARSAVGGGRRGGSTHTTHPQPLRRDPCPCAPRARAITVPRAVVRPPPPLRGAERRSAEKHGAFVVEEPPSPRENVRNEGEKTQQKEKLTRAEGAEVLRRLGHDVSAELHRDAAERRAAGGDVEEDLGVRHGGCFSGC